MDRLLELLLRRFVRRGTLRFATARGSVFTVGDGKGPPRRHPLHDQGRPARRPAQSRDQARRSLHGRHACGSSKAPSPTCSRSCSVRPTTACRRTGRACSGGCVFYRRLQQPCPGRRHAIGGLAEHDRQQVGDGAVLDPERAVHVGFTELDLGVEEHAALGGPGGEMDRDAGRAEARPLAVVNLRVPRRINRFGGQQERPVHRPHPPVSSCPYLANAFPRGRVPSIRRKNRTGSL